MKEIRTGLLVLVVFSVLLGLVYPFLMTGIAQLAFSWRANGSLLAVGDRIVGSELVGQSFSSPGYFHGRPSSCDYDPMNSGGSNLGPTNHVLLDLVGKRIAKLRLEYGLPEGTLVPADLALASASGLDPEISVESALLQVASIAAARGLDADALPRLVQRYAVGPFLGAIGERRVNVLRLNLALDDLSLGLSTSKVSLAGTEEGKP